MVSFFLPLGVETTVGSYPAISYGFISLFFFPMILGVSIYSLSKYDEYLSKQTLLNTVEENELTILSPSIQKEEIKNRATYNPLENFVVDALSLIQGDLNQSKPTSRTKRLIKLGAISLLAVGGTSLLALDAIKNTSSTISPAQAESVIEFENAKISLYENIQFSKVKKIKYISSSLGINNRLNMHLYHPYGIINRTIVNKLLAN
ncbi:hypothetical protein [Prochlorococcus marinus]|uniref:hypothetical protein n=1 Tax=Prochlorococcus marinus TaxID=1219 RepID=UPI0022B5713A|nr:hypothetical protein [Prochlorococcus marinus]